MTRTDIVRYPSRKMTVHYGDDPNRTNLFHIVTTNMNDQSSTEVQLLPDEAKKLVDELTKFLELAARSDPVRFGNLCIAGNTGGIES